MLEINKNLEEKVVSSVPEGYDTTKKILRIYYQLCNTLTYSMSFNALDFLIDYFTDPENLKDVDGEEMIEVVCYSFNAIMAQILVNKGFCDKEWMKTAGIFEKNGKLGTGRIHKTLCVPIGEAIIEFDPANSIIEDNAFNCAKGKAQIKGVRCIKGDKEMLKKAIEEVEEDIKNLEHFEEDYRNAKEEENTWTDVSLEERRDFFIDKVLGKQMSTNANLALPEYIKYKKMYFSEEQRGYGLSQNIELLFITDKEDHSVKCLFLFNKEGYIDDKGYENFDDLEIYEISIADKDIKLLSLDEFKEKCKNNYDEFLGRKPHFQMSQEGQLNVKAKRDEDNNIIGYVRHVLKEDKEMPCDENGNIL